MKGKLSFSRRRGVAAAEAHLLTLQSAKNGSSSSKHSKHSKYSKHSKHSKSRDQRCGKPTLFAPKFSNFPPTHTKDLDQDRDTRCQWQSSGSPLLRGAWVKAE